MMIHPIKIDVTPKNSSYIRIFVSQNDCKSRIIEAQIYSENNLLSDLNAPCKIYYSGSAYKKVEPFYQEAEIVNGVCRFTVPQSVLAVERELFVEIQIGSSEDTSYQLTTEKFLLKVKGQIGTTDSVLGSDEGNLIELYVNTAKENADKTEKIAADIQQLSENIKENTQSAVNEAISNMSIYSKDEIDNLINGVTENTNLIIDEISDEVTSVNNVVTNIVSKTDDMYTKSQVDDLISNIEISTDSYTKDEIDSLLTNKANTSSTYTKGEVDYAINDAINNMPKQDVYSKQEVDNLIDNIPIIDSYTKEEIDNIIDEIPIVDTYTKSEIDNKIDNIEIDSYTKEETNNLLANKADISTTYNKDEVDNLINNIPSVDSYTKSEIDSQMDEKADRTTTYTKEEVNTIIDGLDITESYSKDEIDNKLSSKANSSSVYTKSQVDTAISDMLTNTAAQNTYLSIEDAVRDYVTKAEYTELLTSLETALAQI